MIIKYGYISALLIIFFLIFSTLPDDVKASVIKEGRKTFLLDQTGERWDITEAVSLGFDPGKFEFGIGRNAFQTLDGSHFTADNNPDNNRIRIIGVTKNGESHAYSVDKLRYHETANTVIGSEAIVAGY